MCSKIGLRLVAFDVYCLVPDLARSMICLDNETLHYTSLFGGYRQVKIEEISASRSIVAIHPTRPTVRLEIYQPNQQGPIVINRAIFKPRLIEILVNRLGATLRDDELKV